MENATAKVRQLHELITEVGASVLEAAAAARPDEASVSFGVELTARSGVALAVLAAGEAKASVQVTLTWQLKDQPVPPTPAAPAGAHVPAPVPPAPPAAPVGAPPPAPTTAPLPPPVPHE